MEKINWYNLPQTVRKEIEVPLLGILSQESKNTFKKLKWFSAPNGLNDIYQQLLINFPTCIEENPNFRWQGLSVKVQILISVKNSILNCNV